MAAKRISVIGLVFVITAIAMIAGCKRHYFYMAEEANNNEKMKFTIRQGEIQLGHTIVLTGGKYKIRPGDSTLIYLEGDASFAGVGEPGVATLDFTETARFYFVLPSAISQKEYGITNHSICEIIGSPNYSSGENLFVCQSGELAIDSIKGDKYYGKFEGSYLNTSNNRLTVEGFLRAVQK